jgi:hypothetical protein
MGGTQTTGKTIEDFLHEYEEVRTEYDYRIGEVKIYKKSSKPEIKVLTKEKWFENAQSYNEFQTQIQRRKTLISENVAPLLLVISKPISHPQATAKKSGALPSSK